MGIYKGSPVVGVMYEGPKNRQMCLHNTQLAIHEISRYIPQLEEVINAEDVYDDPNATYELLKVIKELFDSEVENTEQSKSPSFGISNDEFQQPMVESSHFHVNVSKKAIHSTAASPKRSYIKKKSALNSCQSPRIPSTRQSSIKYSPSNKQSHHVKTSSQQIVNLHKNKDPVVIKEVMVKEKTNINTKHKIVEWLQNISLIRRNAVSIAEFPAYCRNGVLLYDLIARLEGKQTSLRNIDRNPKSQTVVFANVKKCLEHLREYEKMNPRYLWSVQDIVDGNADIIWGLLADIWNLYHNKSLRLNSKVKQRTSSKEVCSPFKKGMLPEYSLQVKLQCDTGRKSPIQVATPISTRHNPKQKSIGSFYKKVNKSFNASRFMPIPRAKSSMEQSFSESQRGAFKFPSISEEKQRLSLIWLQSLDLPSLSMNEPKDMLKDPYRNGVLLCDLAEILEHVKLLGKFPNPKAVSQAERNIHRALHTLSKYTPSYYLENTECIQSILKGNKEVIWGLLNSIRESYITTQEYKINIKLPYSNENVKKLEVSLIKWLKRLGVIRGINTTSIFEISREIKNGTLLCEVAEIICKKKLHGVFRNPKTDATALMNIRKALDALRMLPRINLK